MPFAAVVVPLPSRSTVSMVAPVPVTEMTRLPLVVAIDSALPSVAYRQIVGLLLPVGKTPAAPSLPSTGSTNQSVPVWSPHWQAAAPDLVPHTKLNWPAQSVVGAQK